MIGYTVIFTMSKCITEFQRDCTSPEDDPYSLRQKVAKKSDMLQKMMSSLLQIGDCRRLLQRLSYLTI